LNICKSNTLKIIPYTITLLDNIVLKSTYTLFILHEKCEGHKRNYARGMMGMERVEKCLIQ